MNSAKPTKMKPNRNTPNTIVAHTSSGLEMIHLYTGRTITSLKLRNEAVFVDLDFDETIDQIWTSVGHEAQHHKVGETGDHSCSAIFGSGVPDARQVVGNIPICFSGGWFVSQPVLEESKKHTKAAPPALIKRSHSSAFGSSTDYTSVFLLSTGTLTAVRDYQILWQIKIEEMKFFDNGFPCVMPYALDATREANDFHEDILVVANKLALISSHGRILTEQSLESIPKIYPVIGDINGDGLNDVLLVSDSRITIYLIQGTLQSPIFPIILAILLLLVLALHIHRYIHPNSNSLQQAKKYSTD
uniref:FG-GAP repeat-containing protein n=1 Tax=Arcella intermedia TaxID=1963864 RepID=A0A6B2LA84_9EUKA|eukprot:TRINITY_DN14047_c0_g1_i1.p1 TRINITY_DN14047_c0_g1~~TRINITY_DN14047_c0_g1_i1.p1  ORF type:complete len:302 (-),score=73.07 TRINITY_DN14047_c0_g1_i1:14-919(-)